MSGRYDNTVPTSLVGVCIESEASYRGRKAREAHARWLAEPSSAARRREYGHALLTYARTTHDARLRKHAEGLLREGVTA